MKLTIERNQFNESFFDEVAVSRINVVKYARYNNVEHPLNNSRYLYSLFCTRHDYADKMSNFSRQCCFQFSLFKSESLTILVGYRILCTIENDTVIPLLISGTDKIYVNSWIDSHYKDYKRYINYIINKDKVLKEEIIYTKNIRKYIDYLKPEFQLQFDTIDEMQNASTEILNELYGYFRENISHY